MLRMTLSTRRLGAALLCALVLAAPSAYAETIAYDDIDAFLADARSLALEDFDSAPWSPADTALPQPLDSLGVRWTSPEELRATSILSLNSTQAATTIDSGPADQLNAQLPTGTRAAGGWVANAGGGNDVQLTAYDDQGAFLGSIVAPTSSGPPLELGDFFFIGLASTDTDIARVEFVSLSPEANDDFALDDFYFGQGVPEPAGLGLALVGVAAAAGRRRR